MKKLLYYRCIMLFISFILILYILYGCTHERRNTQQTTDNNISKITDDQKIRNADQKVKNAEDSSIILILQSINFIKNKDVEGLKKITSPLGLVLIRNFSSGGGSRGKDIRCLYLSSEFTEDLEFIVEGEEPIALHKLFIQSQKYEADKINIFEKKGIVFNFKDSKNNNIIEPTTEEIRDLCSELTSKEEFYPTIFKLETNELVFTESSMVSDLPVGIWAIFNKNDDKVSLRAVIDLR